MPGTLVRGWMGTTGTVFHQHTIPAVQINLHLQHRSGLLNALSESTQRVSAWENRRWAPCFAVVSGGTLRLRKLATSREQT